MTSIKKLDEEFGRALISNSAIDALSDYAENRLDSVIGDEALKEVPVIKVFLAAAKIGISIRDGILINKLLDVQIHT
jgi:hypothetical protein